MDYRLDEIDKRILYHLVRDARNTSAPDVAEEVNVSPGTIRNRIGQMEDHGVIEGYHADVNYERAEGMLTNRFACTSGTADRAALAKRVLQVPGVVNVREIMTGKADLEVKAVGTDTEDLTRIGDAIHELGVEIEDQDLVKREHFQPYHAYGPTDTRASPSVTDFVDLAGDAEILEFTVHEDTAIAGRTLAEANSEGLLDEGLLVVALERDGTVLTPHGETVVEPGDLVTMFVRDGESDTVKHLFAPPN
jgi:DNA-binding Lrp family transcriptional regulator